MPRRISKQATSSSPTPIPPSLKDPSLPLPRLFIFDLDYTLWPFWIDTHVVPPLKPNGTHTSATDKHSESYTFYVDVPSILQNLPLLRSDKDKESIKLGVASRTHTPQLARDLLKMLHLPGTENVKGRKSIDAFEAGLEIYPSSKIKHFESIHKRTGVAYEDMLFFDDESRNKDTESLGVTMYLVRDGVTWDVVERGVEQWRRRRGYTAKEAS